MRTNRPNLKCPQCDSRLKRIGGANAFECQECGRPVQEEPRTARVGRSSSGSVLGVAIFLSKHDLHSLGIDTSGTDAVTYYVVDGTLRVHGSKAGDQDD